MLLPQNLRYLRKQRKMSQEELAHQIGLNRGNIASYENGSAEPRICNLLKLCDLFGVSVVDLTNRDLSNSPGLPPANGQAKANPGFHGLAPELVERLRQQSEEMGELFKSIRRCCQFSSESSEDLPKECRTLLVYFDQLYEAADALLCNHQALLRRLESEEGEP
jgi:transcriptional regulator with XRE-family HTH domain